MESLFSSPAGTSYRTKIGARLVRYFTVNLPDSLRLPPGNFKIFGKLTPLDDQEQLYVVWANGNTAQWVHDAIRLGGRTMKDVTIEFDTVTFRVEDDYKPNAIVKLIIVERLHLFFVQKWLAFTPVKVKDFLYKSRPHVQFNDQGFLTEGGRKFKIESIDDVYHAFGYPYLKTAHPPATGSDMLETHHRQGAVTITPDDYVRALSLWVANEVANITRFDYNVFALPQRDIFYWARWRSRCKDEWRHMHCPGGHLRHANMTRQEVRA